MAVDFRIGGDCSGPPLTEPAPSPRERASGIRPPCGGATERYREEVPPPRAVGARPNFQLGGLRYVGAAAGLAAAWSLGALGCAGRRAAASDPPVIAGVDEYPLARLREISLRRAADPSPRPEPPFPPGGGEAWASMQEEWMLRRSTSGARGPWPSGATGSGPPPSGSGRHAPAFPAGGGGREPPQGLPSGRPSEPGPRDGPSRWSSGGRKEPGGSGFSPVRLGAGGEAGEAPAASEAEAPGLAPSREAGSAPPVSEPPPLGGFSSDVAGFMLNARIVAGAVRVQVSEKADFSSPALDQTYDFPEDADLSAALGRLEAKPGLYWTRMAFIDLLGYQYPFSVPKKYRYSEAIR